jgi:hypothetical protein
LHIEQFIIIKKFKKIKEKYFREIEASFWYYWKALDE